MKNLRSYLNALPVQEQVDYARRCGTTVGYLRKAISKNHKLGEGLVISLERESSGQVRCEETRPDVDWAFLRGTAANDQHAGAVDTSAAGQGVA